LYLLGAIVQGLAVIAVQPFAIALMDPPQWGRTVVGIGVVQIGGVVLVAALPQAITRAWFDGAAGPHRARAISGVLWIGAPAAAGACILVMTALPTADPTFPVAVAAIGAYAPVIGAQAILRAQGRPVAHFVLTAGCSALAHASGLAATTLAPTSLSYLTGFAASSAVTLAVAFRIARPALPWAAPGAVRAALAAGLPLLPHTLALMLLIQGEPFLLKAAAGDAPAGRYGAVLVFAVAVTVLLGALNNAWMTRIMAAGPYLPEVTRRVSVEGGWAALAVTGGAMALSGPGSALLSAGDTGLAGTAWILPLAGIGFTLYLLGSNLLFLAGREAVLSIVTPAVAVCAAAAALLPAAAGNLPGVAAVKAGAFLALGLTCLWLAGGVDALGRRRTHGVHEF
jgi:O-antigen/teichoic acid export membrane protein